jgi:hypothetical protein
MSNTGLGLGVSTEDLTRCLNAGRGDGTSQYILVTFEAGFIHTFMREKKQYILSFSKEHFDWRATEIDLAPIFKLHWVSNAGAWYFQGLSGGSNYFSRIIVDDHTVDEQSNLCPPMGECIIEKVLTKRRYKCCLAEFTPKSLKIDQDDDTYNESCCDRLVTGEYERLRVVHPRISNSVPYHVGPLVIFLSKTQHDSFHNFILMYVGDVDDKKIKYRIHLTALTVDKTDDIPIKEIAAFLKHLNKDSLIFQYICPIQSNSCLVRLKFIDGDINNGITSGINLLFYADGWMNFNDMYMKAKLGDVENRKNVQWTIIDDCRIITDKKLCVLASSDYDSYGIVNHNLCGIIPSLSSLNIIYSENRLHLYIEHITPPTITRLLSLQQLSALKINETLATTHQHHGYGRRKLNIIDTIRITILDDMFSRDFLGVTVKINKMEEVYRTTALGNDFIDVITEQDEREEDNNTKRNEDEEEESDGSSSDDSFIASSDEDIDDEKSDEREEHLMSESSSFEEDENALKDSEDDDDDKDKDRSDRRFKRLRSR